ncbi:MAG: SHOCT domain-containing protein [Actinomycetota bacterium]|nr:SHOCT domain-containing protein [Actinomycetota bacterium]
MPLGRRGRVGRPGLLGTMARTAVVAGTANATVGAMNRRQQNRAMAANEQQASQQAAYEAQNELAEMRAQMAQMQANQQAQAAPQPAPAAAPAAAPGDDLMGKLQQLADMRNAGILSDDEFAAAKAKLLT